MDKEIQVIIGAVSLLAQPVADVGKFRVLRADTNAQLLVTFAGQGLASRLVLLHMAGGGDVPFPVHIAGMVPVVQQDLPPAVTLPQQQREHRRIAGKMLCHSPIVSFYAFISGWAWQYASYWLWSQLFSSATPVSSQA